MTEEVFVDTQCFLALANPRDSWRAATLAAMAQLSCSLVTSEFVLVEVGDALSGAGERERFHQLLKKFEHDQDVLVIPASHVLFRESVDLHAHRHDKEWSLTDCSSFVIMKQRGIQRALTADHHFDQAGFQSLVAKTK